MKVRACYFPLSHSMSLHVHSCIDPAAVTVLCVPIVRGGGILVGVLELLRKASEPAFGSEDEEIIQSYLSWANVALNCSHSHTNSTQQELLNETLISLTK